MTLKEKTLRGLAWTGIQNWGSRALTFVVFLLLARLLTPEDFGVVALATVFIAFAQVFVDQGFAEALIQREDLEPGHLDTAFWANLGLGVLLSALSFVAAPLVATLFDEPKLVAVVRWLSLLFVLRALAGVQAAILTRDFDFRALAFRRLMGVMAGGVLGVVMAVMGFGVWSLVGQQLCGALVEAGVLWWASDWAPGWGLGREYFKDLFSFGINITGTNLLNFANRRSDDLLIGYFLGPVALGYYTVAYRLLLILTDLLANTINQVALPAFARLQKEPKRLLDAFYKATNLASLLAFPCFVGLAVLAPELTRGVFGEKWLPSVPVMQVLALIGILHSVFNLNAPLMVAVGKPSWRLGVTAVNAVVNVAGFLIAVRWGIVAVAAAYVIRGYLLSPLPLWLLRRLIGLDYGAYLRQYLAPLLGSMALVACVMGVRYGLGGTLDAYGIIAVATACGVPVYFGVVLLVAPKHMQQVFALARAAMSRKSPGGA